MWSDHPGQPCGAGPPALPGARPAGLHPVHPFLTPVPGAHSHLIIYSRGIRIFLPPAIDKFIDICIVLHRQVKDLVSFVL